MLASRGATVVMACRDPKRAQDAVERLKAKVPGGKTELLRLDLSSLASIREAAAELRGRHRRLYALVNNAGVMAIPYHKTADGFEMQLGTNHLGHFAWTGLLVDALEAGGRVVNVSSTAHRTGSMDFNDLLWEKSYSRWGAYGRSKLANLLFTYEMDRRFRAKEMPLSAVACHPGYSNTNLQSVGAQMGASALEGKVMALGNRLVAQSAEMGAQPTVFATVDPGVQGGDYIGPGGLLEIAGPPVKVDSNSRSKNLEDARRLWEVSETLTGVRFLD